MYLALKTTVFYYRNQFSAITRISEKDVTSPIADENLQWRLLRYYSNGNLRGLDFNIDIPGYDCIHSLYLLGSNGDSYHFLLKNEWIKRYGHNRGTKTPVTGNEQ